MKTSLLYLVLLLAATGSHGQAPNPGQQNDATTTRLQQELSAARSDTGKLRLQLALANNLLNQGSDSALLYLDAAEAISRRINNTAGLIEALQLKGTYYELIPQDYRRSLGYYNQGLFIAKQAGRLQDMHDLYGNALNLYFYLGEFINAMRLASEGLSLAEKNNEPEKRAGYHNIIGFIHQRQNNPAAAEHHYRLYLDLARQLKDSVRIADAYNSLGESILMKSDYKTALRFLQQAWVYYYDLYRKNRLPKKDRLPYVLFKTSYAYGLKEDHKKALEYVSRALEYTHTISCNNYDLAQYYIYAGHLQAKTGNTPEALPLLRKGLDIAVKINHKEDLRDAYLYLHHLYSELKNYDSAYAYYMMYDALKDSIINEKTTREIQQLETIYQLEKKDNEIRLLNQQKILQEEKLRKQELVQRLMGGFAILVVITALLLVNRSYLKRKNRLQQEAHTRQSEIFNLTSVIQENERKRIAQDLHDGMGTLLSAAKLKLSSLQETIPAVNDTLLLLDDATAELRHISHNIMPAALSRVGLVAALKNLFEKISETRGISIQFISHGLRERLPEEKEIFIYRIVLELVNNIVKHSRASEATIQLIRYPDKINITVEDDGIGFGKVAADQGTGLSNIRSRVEFLKGDLFIDTIEHEGTTFIINIPC